MAAYVISEVTGIIDAALLEKYRNLAQITIAKYGGRYLVRGGDMEAMEGDEAPERFIVVEFPTMARAKEWYRSPEYVEAQQISSRALTRRLILVEGVASPSGP